MTAEIRKCASLCFVFASNSTLYSPLFRCLFRLSLSHSLSLSLTHTLCLAGNLLVIDTEPLEVAGAHDVPHSVAEERRRARARDNVQLLVIRLVEKPVFV